MPNLDSYDPICVYLVNGVNTGHQMAGAEVIKQIHQMAPNKTIKVFFEEETTDAMNAKDKVLSLNLLDGIDVKWEKIKKNKVADKEKNGLVIFGAYDDIDKTNLKDQIQQIQQRTGCEQCLILQPCNWTHPRAMGIGVTVYNEDAFIPQGCLPLYKTKPHTSLETVKGIDKESTSLAIKEIAKKVESDSIDIVPMYGVHQLPSYGLLESVVFHLATLKREGKPLVMLDPTDKFVSREILQQKGITFINSKTSHEELNSLLNDSSKILFIKTGRVPSDVYDYFLGKARLALYEGANTLQQILNNENPRFLTVSPYGQTPLPQGKSIAKTQEMALRLVHPKIKTADSGPICNFYADFVRNFNEWILGDEKISEVLPLPDEEVFSEKARMQICNALKEQTGEMRSLMKEQARGELSLVEDDESHMLYRELLYLAYAHHSLKRENNFVKDFNAWILGTKNISEISTSLSLEVFNDTSRIQLMKSLEEQAKAFLGEGTFLPQALEGAISGLSDYRLNFNEEADKMLYNTLFELAFEKYSLQRKNEGDLKPFDTSDVSDYLKKVSEGTMEYQADVIQQAKKPESDQLRAGINFLNITMLIKNLDNEIDKENKTLESPQFFFAESNGFIKKDVSALEELLKDIKKNLSTLINSSEAQKEVLSNLKEMATLLDNDKFNKKEWVKPILQQINTLSDTLTKQITGEATSLTMS